MSRFTKFTAYMPLSDGKTWLLDKPLIYEIGNEGSGNFITVPAGFHTDFASVPRLFRVFFSSWEKYGNAAVLHDWLYWRQNTSRKQADDIFYEAMGVLGASYFTRHALYLAVRSFGWIAWRRNKF